MRRQSKKLYFYSFIIPMVILLCIFAILHIFPFGDQTIASTDMNNQYVAILTYVKSNILHPGKLMYSFSVGLGSNFYSVLAYYCMSPFNLLALLFPNSFMHIFFEINLLFMTGALALTLCIYLNNSDLIKHKNQYLMLLISCSYALSAYFLRYHINVMWLDAIVFLPIIVLGFERLWTRRNNGLMYYCFLSLAVISSYYIGFIIVVFLAYTSLFIIIDLHINKGNDWIYVIHRSLSVVLVTLLSIGTSIFTLIPSLLSQSGVNQAPFSFNLHHVFSIKDLFSSFFIGSSQTSAPLIGICWMTIIGIIGYFINVHVPRKSRLLTLIYLTGLLATAYFETSYMVWHAFTLPNGFPQRQSFLILFVMSIVGYKGVESLASNKMNDFCLAITSLLIIVIGFIVSYHFHSVSAEYLIINALLIILTYLAISKYHINSSFIGVIVLINCGIFTFAVWNEYVTSNSLSSLKAYSNVYTINKHSVLNIQKHDKSFYRMASAYQLNMNDPLAFNYNGVSAYVSQQSNRLTDYLSFLGYYQKHSWYRWSEFNNGSTNEINSLLGIKYNLYGSKRIVKQTQSIKSAPVLVEEKPHGIKFNSYGIAKTINYQAFPIAFPIKSNSLKTFTYNPLSNPFNRYNLIFKDIGLSSSLYHKATILKRDDNKIKVRTNISGNLYMYLPFDRSSVPTSMSVKINNSQKIMLFGKYLEGENGIISLGKFPRNSNIRIKINYGSNSHTIPFIYSESHNDFQRLQKQEQSKNSRVVSTVNGNNVINIRTLSNFKGGKIALSIPYDKSWHAKMNGKELPLRSGLGDMNVITVPKGRHEIDVHYRVPGLSVSLIISIMSVVLYLGYAFKFQHYIESK